MISVGFVGGVGHSYTAIEEIRLSPESYRIAIAPGTPGEDMENLQGKLHGLAFARYDTPEALLEAFRPDVLVVSGLPHCNAKNAILGLHRNIPVYCEKPLAITMEEYRALRLAADASAAPVVAMFTIRYEAPFYTAYQAVKEGAVGTVRMIDARKSYKMRDRRPDYYHCRETYGGTLAWVGIHAMDWIAWLSGERFKTVYAHQSAAHNNGNGTMEVTGMAAFTLTGEVNAVLTDDFYRPDGAPTHGDDRVRVVGTKGVLEVRDGAVTLIDGTGEHTLPLRTPPTIFGDFLAGVLEGKPTLLTEEESFYATYASLLATRSADTGQIVTFEEETE